MPRNLQQAIETAIQNRNFPDLKSAIRIRPLVNIERFAESLKTAGLFERILVSCYCGPKHGDRRDLPLDRIVALFAAANKRELRELSDAFPAGETFQLFRGVSGVEPDRRQNGLSWTDSQRRACFYSIETFAEFDPVDPAVFSTVVRKADVLVFRNEEREFIIFPPRDQTRLDLSAEFILAEHRNHKYELRAD